MNPGEGDRQSLLTSSIPFPSSGASAGHAPPRGSSTGVGAGVPASGISMAALRLHHLAGVLLVARNGGASRMWAP
jgi:hypothetical protein